MMDWTDEVHLVFRVSDLDPLKEACLLYVSSKIGVYPLEICEGDLVDPAKSTVCQKVYVQPTLKNRPTAPAWCIAGL